MILPSFGLLLGPGLTDLGRLSPYTLIQMGWLANTVSKRAGGALLTPFPCRAHERRVLKMRGGASTNGSVALFQPCRNRETIDPYLWLSRGYERNSCSVMNITQREDREHRQLGGNAAKQGGRREGVEDA